MFRESLGIINRHNYMDAEKYRKIVTWKVKYTWLFYYWFSHSIIYPSMLNCFIKILNIVIILKENYYNRYKAYDPNHSDLFVYIDNV